MATTATNAFVLSLPLTPFHSPSPPIPPRGGTKEGEKCNNEASPATATAAETLASADTADAAAAVACH